MEGYLVKVVFECADGSEAVAYRRGTTLVASSADGTVYNTFAGAQRAAMTAGEALPAWMLKHYFGFSASIVSLH